MTVTRSVALFVLAGLFEIGGGWLMWQWLRAGRPAGWGLAGAAVLVLYGIVPTLQPANFGRTYATYGGFFIALSLFWGWAMDGSVPRPVRRGGGGRRPGRRGRDDVLAAVIPARQESAVAPINDPRCRLTSPCRTGNSA